MTKPKSSSQKLCYAIVLCIWYCYWSKVPWVRADCTTPAFPISTSQAGNDLYSLIPIKQFNAVATTVNVQFLMPQAAPAAVEQGNVSSAPTPTSPILCSCDGIEVRNENGTWKVSKLWRGFSCIWTASTSFQCAALSLTRMKNTTEYWGFVVKIVQPIVPSNSTSLNVPKEVCATKTTPTVVARFDAANGIFYNQSAPILVIPPPLNPPTQPPTQVEQPQSAPPSPPTAVDTAPSDDFVHIDGGSQPLQFGLVGMILVLGTAPILIFIYWKTHDNIRIKQQLRYNWSMLKFKTTRFFRGLSYARVCCFRHNWSAFGRTSKVWQCWPLNKLNWGFRRRATVHVNESESSLIVVPEVEESIMTELENQTNPQSPVLTPRTPLSDHDLRAIRQAQQLSE